jgi:tetratricopeptide (TPR) repeat protein
MPDEYSDDDDSSQFDDGSYESGGEPGEGSYGSDEDGSYDSGEGPELSPVPAQQQQQRRESSRDEDLEASFSGSYDEDDEPLSPRKSHHVEDVSGSGYGSEESDEDDPTDDADFAASPDRPKGFGDTNDFGFDDGFEDGGNDGFGFDASSPPALKTADSGFGGFSDDGFDDVGFGDDGFDFDAAPSTGDAGFGDMCGFDTGGGFSSSFGFEASPESGSKAPSKTDFGFGDQDEEESNSGADPGFGGDVDGVGGTLVAEEESDGPSERLPDDDLTGSDYGDEESEPDGFGDQNDAGDSVDDNSHGDDLVDTSERDEEVKDQSESASSGREFDDSFNDPGFAGDTAGTGAPSGDLTGSDADESESDPPHHFEEAIRSGEREPSESQEPDDFTGSDVEESSEDKGGVATDGFDDGFGFSNDNAWQAPNAVPGDLRGSDEDLHSRQKDDGFGDAFESFGFDAANAFGASDFGEVAEIVTGDLSGSNRDDDLDDDFGFGSMHSSPAKESAQLPGHSNRSPKHTIDRSQSNHSRRSSKSKHSVSSHSSSRRSGEKNQRDNTTEIVTEDEDDTIRDDVSRDTSIDIDDLGFADQKSPSIRSARSVKDRNLKATKKPTTRKEGNVLYDGQDDESDTEERGSRHSWDEDESIDNSAYQSEADLRSRRGDEEEEPTVLLDQRADEDDEAETLEFTGHTKNFGMDSQADLNNASNGEFHASMASFREDLESDMTGKGAGAKGKSTSSVAASATSIQKSSRSKQNLDDKAKSSNGNATPEGDPLEEEAVPETAATKGKSNRKNFNRYSREQMRKLTADDSGKKSKSKKMKKSGSLIDFVSNVNDVMIFLDAKIASEETDAESDSHQLLHGFEALVGICLQLSDELELMTTFARAADKAPIDALSSLLSFSGSLNDVFAQLRPVIEHYFTHETDEEMNDLLYGMNLIVDLLCELSHRVGEKQQWNPRACTSYATLLELLHRDTLEVVSIFDDLDTPPYKLSTEIESAWNGTGHIEEFETLEEADDLAVFRQICYEVILSTDKWCPDTETLMDVCGIEDTILQEGGLQEPDDDGELALTPETAVQVLDKVNGNPLRRPATLASVLRRVLPGNKIFDETLAEYTAGIRSTIRSPLGLPTSNLIGITSVPEVASDPNALGVAGVGKTTLAALVADHRDVRRHFADGIAWIHLGQKELNYTRYIQCLRDLISQLEVAEEEEPAFPELLRTPGESGSQRRRREEGFLVFVRETMISFLKKKSVLIVLDDVCFESDLDWFDFGAPSDDPEDEVSSCMTLVTTRRRNLLPAADMVEVDMLEDDEAVELLVRESGNLSKTMKAGSKETRSVVRECANHPLAVKSVGRWLNLKHATSGAAEDPEVLHDEVVQSMERILKNGTDDDADMMYEILNMSLSPAIDGEATVIIKFCFAAFVHVFCDKEHISDFALADATPIVPLSTVQMLFEAILGLEEETLLKEGSLFQAQKSEAAVLIPEALCALGVFKVIVTVDEDEEGGTGEKKGAQEEKYLQIMHVVQQEYGEYLLDQDVALRDLSVDAEKRWNKAIAKAYLATKPVWDSDTPDAGLDYALEMMPVHLVRSGMLSEAAQLLRDPAFVKGRLFALGRENGTRRHIKDCETLFDILMKKKASARKKYEPKAMMREAYDTLGAHLNMGEDDYIKEEGSPEAVEVGRCQFEIGFSLAEKRCWDAAIEHWESSQELLVAALGMVEVVAGILYNIGVIYTEMSEYEQALGSLKQCLKVRGTIHGEDHILYAQTIQRIGDVFFAMSDYHEAMESYNWALDVMHIEPSHHRIDIGDILENMGKIHYFKGEIDEALQCFQDALQSKQVDLGEDHTELASIYQRIGNCLSDQNKVEDAVAHLEEAIRLKVRDQFGGEERDADVLTIEGVINNLQGKTKAGLHSYEKALQLLVTKVSHSKEKIATLLHMIAGVYLVSGENKKAMKLFEESLQARRKVLGFVHLDVASTLFSMAFLHQKRNRLDKALKCLEEALKIRQLRLPDGEKVAVTHEKIGTLARSIGKLKKAENSFSEALRIRKLIHGDNHQAVARVLQELGDLMDDLGEYSEAMNHYGVALKIRYSFGRDTLPVAETLYSMGFTLSNSGLHEKSLDYLDEALKIQRYQLGDDAAECGDTLNMLGFLKAKCGALDDAQKFLWEALRIRKLQGDAIKISETLKNIGTVHREKQEYKSAMETYQECLRIRQKELGREHDKVADALVAIGNVQSDLSQPKMAMDSYHEALGIRARLFGDQDASLAPVLQAMGTLEFYGNNYDRALQLLNDFISLKDGNKVTRDGEYVNVLFMIGNIHKLRGFEDQAQKVWTEAYEIFQELGLAESNPEIAEAMEKLMIDRGLTPATKRQDTSSQGDFFPEEPQPHKKGGGMMKRLKKKVKGRGEGEGIVIRRGRNKDKGQKL